MSTPKKNSKTNKTAHVMSLINSRGYANPKLAVNSDAQNVEFEQEKQNAKLYTTKEVESLNNSSTLSEIEKPIKHESEDNKKVKQKAKTITAEPVTSKKAKFINVIEILAKEVAVEVLTRFKRCACDICVCETARYAMEKIPPRFADSEDCAEVFKIKEANRALAIKSVTEKVIRELKIPPKH